jgi:hypothetical protein
VSYKGEHSGGVAFNSVDHPGCTREFTIQSGGVFSWQETLETGGGAQGRVDVEVSVQIVNPRCCGGTGCAAFDLKSNQFAMR